MLNLIAFAIAGRRRRKKRGVDRLIAQRNKPARGIPVRSKVTDCRDRPHSLSAMVTARSFDPPKFEMPIFLLSKAARAGAGVAILPSFADRKGIRDGSLKKLAVRGIQLDQTYLMLVEPPRKSNKPSVELIKNIL